MAAAAAAATTHQHRHQLQTHPPSPQATRRRHKKKPDPFEQLATTPIPSPPSSPASALHDSNEPLLARIILTPIFFTSFLLSLFLVNYRNRARRTHAHASSSSSSSSSTSYPYSSSASSLLAYLVPSRWLHPEPYQDPDDSTWGRRDTALHVEPHDAISPKQQDAQAGFVRMGTKKNQKNNNNNNKKTSWHLHKKICKVAKMEIGDALEMRGRMIAAMAAFALVAGVAGWMGLRWCFVSLSHAWSAAQGQHHGIATTT
ncbi:hypothetical protein COCMIDRAFT_104786 [Bipolaris oryzae ATCC 44560]|uniref:Uncharacterized protein n=1 Tax=Bipolaris oryzae ATCC 44560 TaxID=930090 RepID=W6YWN9_COCMI|nr:uncharacterized protein COCMIDRAFT_104786 [Bipolaris oryzae ATCC 44560]EUC41948.1 hypothetical protein COCMIDRAFT_104786 [Bipolaris oryzae ATCC 44560]